MDLVSTNSVPFGTGISNLHIVVFHHRGPGMKYVYLGVQEHWDSILQRVSSIVLLGIWIDPTSDLSAQGNGNRQVGYPTLG